MSEPRRLSHRQRPAGSPCGGSFERLPPEAALGLAGVSAYLRTICRLGLADTPFCGFGTHVDTRRITTKRPNPIPHTLRYPYPYPIIKPEPQVDTRSMTSTERSDSVNEIRVLASISGAHVISFYEAFVDADILYIVTELGTHGDLQVPTVTLALVYTSCTIPPCPMSMSICPCTMSMFHMSISMSTSMSMSMSIACPCPCPHAHVHVPCVPCRMSTPFPPSCMALSCLPLCLPPPTITLVYYHLPLFAAGLPEGCAAQGAFARGNGMVPLRPG
jgi:hypothetical protein